jgi:hypothetical protein
MVELDADIADIDHMVDMGKAISLFDGVSLINGNVNPVDALFK